VKREGGDRSDAKLGGGFLHGLKHFRSGGTHRDEVEIFGDIVRGDDGILAFIDGRGRAFAAHRPLDVKPVDRAVLEAKLRKPEPPPVVVSTTISPPTLLARVAVAVPLKSSCVSCSSKDPWQWTLARSASAAYPSLPSAGGHAHASAALGEEEDEPREIESASEAAGQIDSSTHLAASSLILWAAMALSRGA
jgi:hypothetical protein